MPDVLTLLDLDTIQSSPYSMRGLRQTLDPIPQAAQQRRTINGALVDISPPQFRKYKSIITCSDHVPPGLDGIWPGASVNVSCVSELSYKTAGGSPARSVVVGSSRVDGDYTFYRPLLAMRVMNFTTETDEWGAVVSWTLELEEI